MVRGQHFTLSMGRWLRIGATVHGYERLSVTGELGDQAGNDFGRRAFTLDLGKNMISDSYRHIDILNYQYLRRATIGSAQAALSVAARNAFSIIRGSAFVFHDASMVQ
jgi:hypothetical protein